MRGEVAKQPASVARWQRVLLPGGMQGPGQRRSARDWVVDVVMFVFAVTLGALALADVWDTHSTLTAVLDIAIGAVGCAALWVRRAHPLAFAVFAVLSSVVSASVAGAGLLAVFNAAIRVRPRELVMLIAVSLVATTIFPALYPGTDLGYWAQVVLGVLLTVIVVGWGLFVRAQRELVDTLRERAEQVEAEQRLREDQAREAERRRIAGEMHDVLAHRVSLLSLHAGALEFRPDAPPEEIAKAAGVIRESARAALQELRQVIGVLREDSASEPEPPQPTLAQIPALVEESRAAGMRVTCTIDAPSAAAMTVAVGRTAYRVVQEGLTNARKHAPDAAVEVRVVEHDRLLGIEVVSRPAVGVAARATGLPGAGTGLIGLAERVELAGGSLSHGTGPGGDFILSAELPWAP